MKIIATNWINVLGVFLVTLFYSVIFSQLNNDLNYSIFQSLVASLIVICLYGMMFWALFLVLLIIVDLLLIVKRQNNVSRMLLIEWALISSPFTYWIIRYEEWIFLIAIITFAITQFLRCRLIVRAQDI